MREYRELCDKTTRQQQDQSLLKNKYNNLQKQSEREKHELVNKITNQQKDQSMLQSKYNKLEDEHARKIRELLLKLENEKKKGNLDDISRCVICLENKNEILLYPCRHVCLCQECSRQTISNCPVCYTIIKNKKRVFLP